MKKCGCMARRYEKFVGKLVDITCQVPFKSLPWSGRFFLSRLLRHKMTMSSRVDSVQDGFRRNHVQWSWNWGQTQKNRQIDTSKKMPQIPWSMQKQSVLDIFFSTRVCKPNAFLPLWSTHMVRMRQNSGHIAMCDARIVHDFWNLHTEYIFLDYYGFSVQLS